MANERAAVFESCRFGVNPILDPTANTDALKLMESLGLEPTIKSETSRFRPYGRKYDTRLIPGRDWTEYKMAGRVDYKNINYALSSVINDPDISTPGGATNAREWLYETFASAPDLSQTYTIETGSVVRAQQTLAAQCTDIEMVFRRESAELNGSWIAKTFTDEFTLSSLTVKGIDFTGTVSGGTYTITVDGDVTSAIPWNANADTVRSALGALDSVGSERNVLVTGGPGPVDFVVTFFGALEGTVPVVSASGASLTGGGSVAITAIQSAGTLTTVTSKPVRPGDVSIYVDTAFANIGTTKLTRVFQANAKLGGRFGPIWVLNDSETSYANTVEIEPDLSVRLKMMANGAGMAYLNSIRNEERLFMRIEAVGPEIESGQNYLLRWDMAAEVESPDDFGTTDGAKTVDWTFRGVDDDDFGGALRVLTRSEMTQL